MGRAPCCEKVGLKKGRWTAEEDQILTNYIQTHGEGSWRSLPKNAGLLRCGKSCRLRWINYLRTDVKRGNITPQEEDLIVRLHQSLGNRWSHIAGHLPGRTDNEIKNYWNSHLSRKIYHFRRPLRKGGVVVVGGQEPAATTSTVISDITTPVATVPKRRPKTRREGAMKKQKLLLTSLSDNKNNNSGTKTDNDAGPETSTTGKRLSGDKVAESGLQVLVDGTHGSGAAGQGVLEGAMDDEWLKSDELLWLDRLLQSDGDMSTTTTEKGVSMQEENSGMDEWFNWDYWGNGNGNGNGGENMMPPYWLWDTSNNNGVID